MIAKQLNGKYCRISTIVNAPTFENKTKEEVENYLIESKQLIVGVSVDLWLKSYCVPFEYAVKQIINLNMTQQEIDDWVKIVTEGADE